MYDLAGNVVTKNDNAYGYDQLNRLIGANEKGWFTKKNEEIAANYGIQDRDYDGSKQIAFTLNPMSTVGLDGAKKSFAVDLGKVYGVSQLELLPNQANHRVRAKDLTIYLSNDNQTYTKTNAWVLDKKTDGSLVITFNEILQTRYIKVKSIWDDRDLENVSVDKATFRNQVNQLIKVHAYSDSHQEAYEYDSMGNRTKLTVDGTVTNSTYFKNSSGGNLPLLANDGTWSYAYDDNGNRVSKTKVGETWNYIWDLYNRLIQVKKNGMTVANYTYDSNNLRVEKSTPTDTTIFAFGRSGAITYQKNLTKDLQKVYTYMGGSLLGWNETQAGVTKQYFVATDHLGSVTQVTDSTGSVVWSSEYLPFGALSGVLGTYDFDGIYAGHQNDNDVGLVYMNARWQDPSTGMFISEDPARDGSNWYGYGGNRPLVNVDPSGLFDQRAMFAYRSMIGYEGLSGFWGGISNDMGALKAGIADTDHGFSNSVTIGYQGADYSGAFTSTMFTPGVGPLVTMPGYGAPVITPTNAGSFYDPSYLSGIYASNNILTQIMVGLNSPSFGGDLQDTIHQKVNGNVWGRDSFDTTGILTQSTGIQTGTNNPFSFSSLSLSFTLGWNGKGIDWSFSANAAIGARTQDAGPNWGNSYFAGMLFGGLTIGTLPQYSQKNDFGIDLSGGFFGSVVSGLPNWGSFGYGWTGRTNSSGPEVSNITGDIYGSGFLGAGFISIASSYLLGMPNQYSRSGVPLTIQGQSSGGDFDEKGLQDAGGL